MGKVVLKDEASDPGQPLVRARLRVKIKTLLKRYKYPPDAQKKAINTVLQQAETLGEDLVAPPTQ